MSSKDWFRRTTWTEFDRADFNARLKRCRGAGNKAQYLRIQASHLAEAGHHAAAIELLDRMLTEFPEKIQLASAHLQKTESQARLDQTESAIKEYRGALQAERYFPNVRTNAWLDFAWFVVEKQLTDLYGEALQTLKEFRDESGLTFPVIEYRYCAVRAIIADSFGDKTIACDFARRAIEEAGKEHSGLRYHPRLGLVGSQDSQLDKKLRTLEEKIPRTLE